MYMYNPTVKLPHNKFILKRDRERVSLLGYSKNNEVNWDINFLPSYRFIQVIDMDG